MRQGLPLVAAPEGRGNADDDDAPIPDAHHDATRSTRTVVQIIASYLIVFYLLLPAFLVATALRLDVLLPIGLSPGPAGLAIVWCAVAVGAAIQIAAAGQLCLQGKGLPFSHLPPSQFVGRGLYKYVRHPIYVGYTVTFLGAATLLGSFWAVAFSTPFLLVGWIGYVSFYEESRLLTRFGKCYEQYRTSTPLLLPKAISRTISPRLAPAGRTLCRWLTVMANRTILFRHGDLIIVTYGALVALGTLIAMQHVSALLFAHGLPRGHVAAFLAGSVLAAAFFSRLAWWLDNWRTLIKQPLWGLRRVGFVSFGGLFGLIAFACVFAAIAGYPVLMVTDAIMRAVFAAYALGRLGCLTYGCCWGLPAKTYGIVYQHPEAKVIREQGAQPVCRSPNPVFSFIEGTVLFLLVNSMPYLSPPVGLITAAAFVLYPIGRSLIEFNRDRRRYLNGLFTDGHIACLVMFSAGCSLLFFVSPALDRWASQPCTRAMLVESLSVTPVALATAAVVFLVTGVHWKKVGTW